MQTKTIGLVVGIVVLIIVGYMFTGSKYKMDSEVKNSDEAMENIKGEVSKTQTDQAMGKKMAFSEYIRGNGSYKCEVSQNMSGVNTEGTVYVSGGMMRGEYNSVIEGRTMQMTMVVKDGYTYSWNSMMPGTGFKAKVMEADTNTGTNVPSNYSFDTSQVGEYNCQNWVTDASKFTIPTNIKFQSVISQ